MRAYHLLPAEFALSDIKSRRLKISRWRDLNDPFELAIYDQTDENSSGGFERSGAEWDERHGVLCFSKSWSNPLIWSHYADKHRGMALGFDVSGMNFCPIEYVTERPKLTEPPTLETVRQWMFCKFKGWEYEEEIRAQCNLDPDDVDEKGLRFVSFDGRLALREVILGARCETPIAEIDELVKSFMPRVRVLKATLSKSAFEIVAADKPR